MKCISVKLIGSATPPFTIQVNPGDTAGKVLGLLNLEGSVLVIPPSPILYLAPDDDVYDKLMEGDFLLVMPKDFSTIDLPKAREDLHQLLGIGDEEPYKLRLRPRTKVSDVLSYLNLSDDYVLQPLSDPTKTLYPEENLYDVIENDAKLIATLSPQAVEKYANTFLHCGGSAA
jgi:hypothetical protein